MLEVFQFFSPFIPVEKRIYNSIKETNGTNILNWSIKSCINGEEHVLINGSGGCSSVKSKHWRKTEKLFCINSRQIEEFICQLNFKYVYFALFFSNCDV